MQDDWKVTPNFTVNLGLRYEYTTPYYGQGASSRTSTSTVVPASWCVPPTTTGISSNTDRNNFAPRLGFAYQVKPERLVLRGGYGLFYGGEDFRGSGGMTWS